MFGASCVSNSSIRKIEEEIGRRRAAVKPVNIRVAKLREESIKLTGYLIYRKFSK